MNSFYKTCKKKSKQMTELVLIGLIMIIFVIVSSWGTKIINYYNGPIALKETVAQLSKYDHKDSFDLQDPQNQYVKINTEKISTTYFKSHKGFYYYTQQDQNNDQFIIAVNKEVHSQIQNNHEKTEIIGGFDIFNNQEKALFNQTPTVMKNLIFRSGNVGDSQMIEITISIYLTIAIMFIAIIMILLEVSGFYIRTTKKQIHHIISSNQALIDNDYKERLKKNKLGFGDIFLYLSKNWHYEIYEFQEIALIHYHIHRYGHFNRYTLVGWNTDKRSFVIAKMLTKEKLMAYMQLIYERNPEIVVEKTVEGKNKQLYYFDRLVGEMRDRQKINQQLMSNKESSIVFHKKSNHRLPILLRTKKNIRYQKYGTRRIFHMKNGPLR